MIFLSISYRSTAQIMAVANTVLGSKKDEDSRQGEPVLFQTYESRDEALNELQEIVLRELEKSPNGLIAVICKQKNEITHLYQKIRAVFPGVRKEPQQFQPGILVINAHQVKGLEFTSVILWNASAKVFRTDNKHDRNLLYVCLSRACERLAVLCHEQPTSFLKSFF